MAKKKYYAVRIGLKPGIYSTWSDVQPLIKGFPGANYKSFSTLDEADLYMQADQVEMASLEESNESINNIIAKMIVEIRHDEVLAFVDGSYSPDAEGREKYGYGAVLIDKENEYELHKSFVNQQYMNSRNVAGEIEGVKDSILWAIQNKKKSIHIFYDYNGIENWAEGKWKTNKPVSRDYKKFIDDSRTNISINFTHVKAHSGISYNEKADQLAKDSLLSHGYKTYSDGSIYIVGLDSSMWESILRYMKSKFSKEHGTCEFIYEIQKPKDYLTRYTVKYNGNSLIINSYNGGKSYVQGKQSILFEIIISYAIEKIPNDEVVIKTLNNYHGMTVEKSEVEIEFTRQIPNFPTESTDIKIKNNLLNAVFNTMITGYKPDYTDLVFPICRAFEYYLHRILSDVLHKTTTRLNGSNNFSFFDKNSAGTYSYNGNVAMLTVGQPDLLNALYNSYNKVRHPYLHWSFDSVDTPVITDISTARQILYDGLKVIDNYYIIFK